MISRVAAGVFLTPYTACRRHPVWWGEPFPHYAP